MQEIGKVLAQYVSAGQFDEFPKDIVDIAKKVVLRNIGTIFAGAKAEGCEAVVNQIREWGGKEEATILVYGGKVPAHNAALANSVMARALDFDDAMTPGMHLGASTVPAALAAAELNGGCSGRDFLAALMLGNELAARLNLDEHQYDGFDPTGVCAVFATAAIAGRILRLNVEQMLNALSLAFNRCAGSFQSNIDGALAVRLIQGFASQNGLVCAQLARRGLTGPKNYLTGTYGYFHLYGRDRSDPLVSAEGLGKKYESSKIIFKRYPSCAGTFSSTDAMLELIRHYDLAVDNVAHIDVTVTPYMHKLVGGQFVVGENPKVSAQFNIQYCVANVLLRRSSKLAHFDEGLVREPKIKEITEKISVFSSDALETRGHTAMDMCVKTVDGKDYCRSIDIASGFPGKPLSQEEHAAIFKDCIEYAANPSLSRNIDTMLSMTDRLEELKDVRVLTSLFQTNS